jgi:hypothetical protein
VTETYAAASRPSRFERTLSGIPVFLSSHPHVILLMALGVYLIVLPLCGVHVPAQAELVGGNYFNVTSDIGACIAAGGTVHLVKRQRQQGEVAAATHRIAADLYRARTGAGHPAEIAEITGPGE